MATPESTTSTAASSSETPSRAFETAAPTPPSPLVVERTVVATFEDRAEAEEAIRALEQAGFDSQHIGFIVRGSDLSTPAVGVEDHRMGTAEGVLTGGMIGGVLATAATLLIPAIGPVVAAGLLASLFGGTLAGMAIGGMIGALNDMGVGEEEAQLYVKEFRAGRAIVAVRAGARWSDAANILADFGGKSMQSTGEPSNLPPIYPQP